MKISRIQARTNQRVKDLLKMKDRYFFFEGEKLVEDILQRDIEVSVLIVEEGLEEQFIFPEGRRVREVWYVSETVMEKISTLKEKPGLIAVLEWEEGPIDYREARVVIGIDNLQDPANVGTVFRCAAAFGIDAIAITGGGVKLNNSKFLRAAQDSFFKVKFRRYAEIKDLLQEVEKVDFNIYLTSSHETGYVIPPHYIQKPCLIIFGNEGQGLEGGLFERYPTVKIPQKDVMESLNVGVSACIIMYELNFASSPLTREA